MGIQDESEAWALFVFNWILLAAAAVLLLIGLAVSGLRMAPAGMALPGYAAAGCGALALAAWRIFNRHVVPVFILGTMAQFIVLMAVMTPLTYVAAASGLPLQDADLGLADRMLGLDWRDYLQFVDQRPRLTTLLALGYSSIGWQLVALPLLLGLSGHHAHLGRFALALLLTLLAVTAVSALVPAVGAYQQLGLTPADHPHIAPLGYLDTLRDLPRVRSGALRLLDERQLVGIVTFPSFHAAAALLYLWAFWSVWWARPGAILVNGAMLAATPIGGGHYFVDVLAGLVVAMAGIGAATSIGRRLPGFAPARAGKRGQPVPVPALTPGTA